MFVCFFFPFLSPCKSLFEEEIVNPLMHSYFLLVIICFLQVVDVAKAIINAIKDPDAKGKTYALAG